MSNVNEKIQQLVQSQELLHVVIFDRNGDPLEMAGDLFETEILAATFSPFLNLTEKMNENLGISKISEFIVNTQDASYLLVLKYFTIQADLYFLFVAAPSSTSSGPVRERVNEIVQDMINKLSPSPDEDIAKNRYSPFPEEKEAATEPVEPHREFGGSIRIDTVETEKGKRRIVHFTDDFMEQMSRKVVEGLSIELTEKTLPKKIIQSIKTTLGKLV
jgi:predicted regulator of Ras-like GTPase activity (Roadblock/LC7/MglB family)